MRYYIKTLEFWETIAEYEVEAESEEKAVEMVRKGEVSYDDYEHPGNADQFGEVLEISQIVDDWYFTMDGMDVEEFGPYDTELEALEGIRRVREKGEELGDGVERTFTAPYQGKRDSVWND